MYPKNKGEKFTHEKWLNKVFTVDFFLFLGTKLESIDFPNIDVERVEIITPECYIFSLKKAILQMCIKDNPVQLCLNMEHIKHFKGTTITVLRYGLTDNLLIKVQAPSSVLIDLINKYSAVPNVESTEVTFNSSMEVLEEHLTYLKVIIPFYLDRKNDHIDNLINVIFSE